MATQACSIVCCSAVERRKKSIAYIYSEREVLSGIHMHAQKIYI
jgi:hypothetical protein